MRNSILKIGFVGLFGLLAACDTDAERGLVGAVAGAAVSEATGGSAATGAILGGAAGVFCDDAGVCK